MIVALVQFIVGVLLLTKAADWFTRAAAQIAAMTGLPRVLLGATLIGFSTNLPEFSVSISAAWSEHGGIALGNPVGSNIVNTGLVLGLSLLQVKVAVKEVWLRDHGFPLILGSLLTYALMLAGDLTWPAGLVMVGGCAGYIALSVITAERDPQVHQEAEAMAADALGGNGEHRWSALFVLIAISAALVIWSSSWVLASAVTIATILQVPESVIALSLVAFGTSLPELATVVSASGKGHHDTSMGIVLGSNVYNVLGVLGTSALIGKIPVSAANRLFDFPVMLMIVMLPMLPCLFGRTPGRKTGVVLLAVYALYTYGLFNMQAVFDE